MTSTPEDQTTGLHKGTNWWGCFVIGLAAPILVTGIDPPAVQALGAAAVPLLAITTAIGFLLCLFAAELAAVMPDRTGGIPSYTMEAFEPLHRGTSKHLGGVSAWAYWLGWFPVAPINMILASAYVTQLFGIPQGRSFLPFGGIGSPVSLAALIISVIGICGMYVPSYLGIRLGAGFATVMGILGMAPLTLLILLPFFRPSSMHFSNLAGFHYAPGVVGSPTLILAWIFVMTCPRSRDGVQRGRLGHRAAVRQPPAHLHLLQRRLPLRRHDGVFRVLRAPPDPAVGGASGTAARVHALGGARGRHRLPGAAALRRLEQRFCRARHD
jgi:amino acid transporter